MIGIAAVVSSCTIDSNAPEPIRSSTVAALDEVASLDGIDCATSILIQSGLDADEGEPIGCWSLVSSGDLEEDFLPVAEAIGKSVGTGEWRLYCASTYMGVPMSVCNAFFDLNEGESLLRVRFLLLEQELVASGAIRGDTGVVTTMSTDTAEERIATRYDGGPGSARPLFLSSEMFD